MDIEKIKELALVNGFKLKEQASGNMDLNAYVYDFANAIEQAAKAESHKSASLYQLEINHLASANQQLRDYAAKASAVPDGFVLVAKKSVEHWYLDEGESLWMDEPDNWLCDMDVGDVQEVEHKEYIVTESNTLYATKVWDGENQAVSSWEFFSSKDDAEKAAEYCKAMIEAQEQTNDK